MNTGFKADLNGKVTLITNTDTAIGRTVADAFEECGAVVIRTGQFRRGENLDSVTDNLIRKYSRIDVLVNIVFEEPAPEHRRKFWEYDDEEWESVLDNSLHSVFYVSKHVAAKMVERGSGCIINVSSALGVIPMVDQCARCTCDAAINHLTRAMASEIADRGVRVNAVCPGPSPDGRNNNIYDGTYEKVTGLLSHIPMHREGSFYEKAAVEACFLASDAAAYITGHVFVADGGWTASYSRDF